METKSPEMAFLAAVRSGKWQRAAILCAEGAADAGLGQETLERIALGDSRLLCGRIADRPELAAETRALLPLVLDAAMAERAVEFSGFAKSAAILAASPAAKGASRADLGLALLCACAERQPDLARSILENGADLQARSALDGSTALHLAAQAGSEPLVALLLEKGADPSARAGRDGQTPLHRAAASGAGDCCEALLRSGASPHAADAFGKTPVDRAGERGASAALAAIERSLLDQDPPLRPSPKRASGRSL